MTRLFTTLLTVFLLVSCTQENNPLPRVIIASDINNAGGDPDDKQSMAHLFMYANQVDIVSIIPDYWTGKGVEATMQTLEAYEKDYDNPEYNFRKLNYPEPDRLRGLVRTSPEAAIQSIITEASKDEGPVHILIWGGMITFRDALRKSPCIVDNIRIYTIGTHRMAENLDSRLNSKDTTVYGLRNNWNGHGRNDIYDDPRFDKLWWLENDWAYNGMFEGEEPGELLEELKDYGALGHYIWNVVQAHEWAHYFRAGDTPTLLYLLEPGVHIDDPATSSWAGRFTRPCPESRPNYWIDDAGIEDWDYAHPENSWENAKEVYDYRVNGLLESRDEMYGAFRQKLQELYNR